MLDSTVAKTAKLAMPKAECQDEFLMACDVQLNHYSNVALKQDAMMAIETGTCVLPCSYDFQALSTTSKGAEAGN